MSVGEAKAVIRQSVQALNEGRRTLESVAPEVDDTRALARLVLHDSQHSEVEKGLKALAEAVHELELTLRRLRESVDAANEYLAALG